MPTLEITTNAATPSDRDYFLQETSKLIAEMLNKPEKYVCVTARFGADMLFGGDPSPAAVLRLTSIGALGPDVNKGHSATLCGHIHAKLGVSPDRIYIHMVDMERSYHGWNSATFA